MSNPAPSNTSSTHPQFTQYKSNNQSLQDLLHTLITRLSESSEIIKSWPEQDGPYDNSIHTETTSKLITSIHKVVDAIRLVEERVNPNIGEDENDKATEQEIFLANQLRQTAIPLDLLDMMDTNTLNPDCFARGMLSEALRQFSNLGNRKNCMNMLASLVENGFQIQMKMQQQREKEREMKMKQEQEEERNEIELANVKAEELDVKEDGESKKRKRELDEVREEGDNDDTITEPPTKKQS